MALTTRLEFRQSQALVMTPQLMQAIKLLQLSNLDLMAYVEEELEKNPLLERVSDDDGPALPGEVSEPASVGSDGEGPQEWMGEDLATSRNAIEDDLGTRLDNVFPDDGGPAVASARAEDVSAAHSEWASVGTGGRDDGEYNLEAFVSAELTLADHLAEQLSLSVTDPAQRMIGQHLIDMVDEAGYLSGDIAAVADKLGASMAEVEAVLAILQGFDPAGVCARNLTECLAIQLKELNRYDPAMEALLGRLDLLAKRDFASLRKLCGVSDEDLADMVAEIKRLNPKPGLAFGSASVQPIVPDVFVRAAPDGTFHVELNSDTLPKILLNQVYHARVSKNAATPADKTYLAEKLQSATWLIRALDQRARTILKVSAEIVKQQDAFFAHGVQHLRPLNLKTIADAISMHESTVSRVTANKYMATARGIFELKYFFTSAIAAANGGEAHSAEAVRHRIKHLIDSETPNDILSDDTIVEKLREAGIDIARRTVAKYREGMRIASSVQRRREKQGAALSR
ncbi:RNA polymerase factor sigma-54 [Pseudorhodoplanes sp.]|uniref:RNA polymerase factor sigma-54 n=1 Tax=Pseudorhodoplanes sp. TaxID=1934341 RepID=UPI002C03F034|nr:RNA polymerase factor sigma-54 [Pseudorhodoplanes sp.]HWV53234.1 RNA polymerase factor sigma-54 [Pseudorhodoplanes sp.]